MADDQPESGYGSQRRIDLFVQRVPTTETKRNHVNIPLALSSFAALLKAAVPVVILALIVWNWSYFATWLDSITHGELPGGFKFDRAAAAEKLRELKTNRDFNLQFADGVLIRAKFVLPALSGARVLWVDGEPSHNLLEQGILRDIGINVQLALATPEALNLARKVDFDLIISNLVRDGDITTPLERCGAVYFAFPNSDLSAKYGNDLVRFNVQTKEHPPAGFAMAEKLAQEFPNKFGDSQLPRIIFYTLSSGGIAASQCGRIVTNRPDVLLQSVVSALEEFRWEQLTSSKTQNKAGAQ